MSFRMSTRRVLAVSAAAAAAVAGVSAVGATDASAATSTLFTITAVAPHHVAALTKNQIITVTGTGFDESSIKSVAVAGCTTAPNYIVESATTLLLKTAGTDCAVGNNAAITLTDSSNNTYATTPTTGGKTELDFVAAPTILTPTASARPMVTVNSAGVAYASQVTKGSTSGGTAVRVYAGGTAFTSSAAYPLKAWLDGVAMTKVTMHTGGDYFDAVLGAHAADAAPTLKITSNGATGTFTYAATGTTAGTFDFQYADSTVSVSPSFGPLTGAKLTITGTGFKTATPTVTVGSGTCGTVTVVSATKLTCVAPGVTTAAPQTVTVTVGSVVSAVGPGSTFTYVGE